MNRIHRSGFTLLEILVVLAIITILGTLVGVSVARHPGQARRTAAETQIRIFRQALQLYRMEQGMIPTTRQGLEALCRKPDVDPLPARYPAEGYLESPVVPKDPWGNPYAYRSPGPEGAIFEVISYGSDGEPGGDGEAADMTSANL
ncbi:MAG: type II secretion system protein GspG [Lentisphaerae bacterium RIFOXYC12_FULL_60_16]|nr:MAG: type II secretion system protein GspG [Lentisphaerae bacterium RIFOXYC12_FULL_60_16]OGV83487.1 MAG: type II secretion system protein GspG [Lentisphaerae bacterium RIFOXYB12_FULL_60_10]